MIKLALVDDDPRLLTTLKAQLVNLKEIDSIVTCNGGMKFVSELNTTLHNSLPDVVIMDISMELPDEGIKATRKIKELYPQIKIVMFTISDNDDLVFEAFKAGAMGYLLKDETPDFILKTILDVHNGEAQMSPAIARKTISYLVSTSRPSQKTDEGTALSPRELETINLVAKGYTYNEIGTMLNIAPSTAKKHMTNIFAKLHVNNKIEALIKTEHYRTLH